MKKGDTGQNALYRGKNAKSVLLRLKRSAYGVGAGGGKAGTDRNSVCGAVAVTLVVMAVFYIAVDAVIHVVTATGLMIMFTHFFHLLFR